MKIGFKRLMLPLACVVAVSGCASQNHTSVQVDPAVVKLSEAADEISHAYKVLSYAESARASSAGIADGLNYDISEFPTKWQERYVLEEDFYGELEPFLRGLSKLAGYDEPQVIGRRPVVPIAVTVDRSKKALAEYLIDVSYQAGSRANVVMDPDKSRLLITYAQ